MAGTTKCTMLRYRPGGMVNYLKKGTAMPAEVGEVAPDFYPALGQRRRYQSEPVSWPEIRRPVISRL